MSDFMSQSYHEVMEAYKRPPSIRFIPRIFGWLTVFILLFGVSKTAYAYETEPVIWVQVPQWTDDWAVCAVVFQTQHVIGMLQTQTIHLEKDSTGRQLLGSMLTD